MWRGTIWTLSRHLDAACNSYLFLLTKPRITWEQGPWGSPWHDALIVVAEIGRTTWSGWHHSLGGVSILNWTSVERVSWALACKYCSLWTVGCSGSVCLESPTTTDCIMNCELSFLLLFSLECSITATIKATKTLSIHIINPRTRTKRKYVTHKTKEN